MAKAIGAGEDEEFTLFCGSLCGVFWESLKGFLKVCTDTGVFVLGRSEEEGRAEGEAGEKEGRESFVFMVRGG